MLVFTVVPFLFLRTVAFQPCWTSPSDYYGVLILLLMVADFAGGDISAYAMAIHIWILRNLGYLVLLIKQIVKQV